MLTLDLASVEPHVSGPNSVKVFNTVSDLERERINIHKAYLVSCVRLHGYIALCVVYLKATAVPCSDMLPFGSFTQREIGMKVVGANFCDCSIIGSNLGLQVNSRQVDIAAAAEIVRGNKVADGVEFYIAAASSEVQADSEESGDWQTLMDAGCIELPPGCGPCIGLGMGMLVELKCVCPAIKVVASFASSCKIPAFKESSLGTLSLPCARRVVCLFFLYNTDCNSVHDPGSKFCCLGILDENEVAISATNRNFKGRMGAASARAYLASPTVVAASALAG